MDTIKDKITKIINKNNKKNELVYTYKLVQLYKQLNLDSLIELKHKNMKNPKPEYGTEYDEDLHYKVRNYESNNWALEYTIYKKLGGDREFDCWIKKNNI